MEKKEGLEVVKNQLKRLSYIHDLEANFKSISNYIKKQPRRSVDLTYQTDGRRENYEYFATDNVREQLKTRIYYDYGRLNNLLIEIKYYKQPRELYEVGTFVIKAYDIMPINDLVRVLKTTKEKTIYRKNGYFTDSIAENKSIEFYQNKILISSMNISPVVSKKNILKRTLKSHH